MIGRRTIKRLSLYCIMDSTVMFLNRICHLPVLPRIHINHKAVSALRVSIYLACWDVCLPLLSKRDFSAETYRFSIIDFFLQAARLLASLIVMGSSIVGRAVVQAYKQALTNASRNGVAQEAVQNIRRASKTLTEVEAREILGVPEQASWPDILQKYDNLFERNAKNGSFYLQSKVHRAKECLEAIHQPKAPGSN
ncbi:transporter [Lithospermum erythrorhizon]|uniref:Transporter n=1 Tax=Lithospermum erythrorhizon TaxID=34254 RepID=A0AAV3NJ04_LITER